jgi:hypothetical protein
VYFSVKIEKECYRVWVIVKQTPNRTSCSWANGGRAIRKMFVGMGMAIGMR